MEEVELVFMEEVELVIKEEVELVFMEEVVIKKEVVDRMEAWVYTCPTAAVDLSEDQVSLDLRKDLHQSRLLVLRLCV